MKLLTTYTVGPIHDFENDVEVRGFVLAPGSDEELDWLRFYYEMKAWDEEGNPEMNVSPLDLAASAVPEIKDGGYYSSEVTWTDTVLLVELWYNK